MRQDKYTLVIIFIMSSNPIILCFSEVKKNNTILITLSVHSSEILCNTLNGWQDCSAIACIPSLEPTMTMVAQSTDMSAQILAEIESMRGYFNTKIPSSWGILRMHEQLEYCRISNIIHTKSPNLTVSRLILQLTLPNPMKPGIKSRMKI